MNMIISKKMIEYTCTYYTYFVMKYWITYLYALSFKEGYCMKKV